MDDVTREKARAVFARLGLTEEQAIELFYKRTIEAGRMPFAAAEEKTRKNKEKADETNALLNGMLSNLFT